MSARRAPTQLARVLVAMRRAGTAGVTQVDFIAPTLDAGPSILRVASRVAELRDRGYVIETRHARVGAARIARYVLVSEPPDRPTVEPDAAAGEQATLDVGAVVVSPRPRSPLDPDQGGPA